MKKLSALLLSAALCFTSVPAFANEIVADDEEITATYNLFQEYDGWIYGNLLWDNTVLNVPCDGTIQIQYMTRDISRGSEPVKVMDANGNLVATMKSSAEDIELGKYGISDISVTKGTYYLTQTDTDTVYAYFTPSVDYTGWAFNGYNGLLSSTNFTGGQDSEIWYYYKDGELVEGWQYIGNDWYYFYTWDFYDIAGVIGFTDVEPNLMASDTFVYDIGDDGGMYFVSSSGKMVRSGWVREKRTGCWYYIKADGTPLTDSWKYSKGKWYWLNENGVMATNEWLEQDGNWYYVRANGAMAANETICGNKFDSHGVWLGKK